MKYRTIVADPPWQYLKSAVTEGKSRLYAEDRYATMTMEKIAALPVREVAADNAHLYLWVTNPRLYHDRHDHQGTTPYDIMRAWGFDYRTTLTWVKGNGAGMGAYYRIDTEHVLFGIRGNAPIAPSNRVSNVFYAPRRGHSEKPEVFLDLVEQISPGPYLELFARRVRLGWQGWGEEWYEGAAW